jgi:hypothetical protein
MAQVGGWASLHCTAHSHCMSEQKNLVGGGWSEFRPESQNTGQVLLRPTPWERARIQVSNKIIVRAGWLPAPAALSQ